MSSRTPGDKPRAAFISSQKCLSPLSETYSLVSSEQEPKLPSSLVKKITVDHLGPAHGRSVGVQAGARRCTSLIGEAQILAEVDPSPGLSLGAQTLQHRDTGRPVPQCISFSCKSCFSCMSPFSCMFPMHEQRQGSPCSQAAPAASTCLQVLPWENARGGRESCKSCRACPAEMNILPWRAAWDDGLQGCEPPS